MTTSTSSPLVSVVMPAYNAERYISESIESILAQTVADFELIVIDDASTDRTWEIVQAYAARDARLVAVRNKSNQQIAATRNRGIGLAQGRYIAWQDADDRSRPTRLAKQVAFLEAHPAVGICGGYLQSFDSTGLLDVRRYPEDDATLRRNLFRCSPVAQPCAMVRKACFDEMGGFDLSMPPAEDLEFSFRLGTRYQFANLPEVLLDYREHPDSATYRSIRTQIRNTLRARWRYSRGAGYRMTAGDWLAQVATWLVQFLPAPAVVKLFKRARSRLLRRALPPERKV